MAETERSRLIVGTLFKLETAEGVKILFQNFYTEGTRIFTFENEDYPYLPIEYDPPERNINMDNPENDITLPAIPEVITILEAYNYFIDSIVTCKIILKGFPSVPVITDTKAVISTYSIQDSSEGKPGVSLVIQAPDYAYGNRFPNSFYFSGVSSTGLDLIGFLPNVPLSNNANLQ